MKKIRSFIFFTFIFLFFITDNVFAIDNFEINELKVNIRVNNDGTYDIEESYEMDYFLPALGFYRDLPSVYHMDFRIDNKRVNKTYYFPITNITLEGDVYKVESQTYGEQIIVGPDYGERFTGIKNYVIKYKVHTQSLDLVNSKEVFFYNLVSDWRAPIHKFSAEVIFSDDVDIDKLTVIGTTYLGDFDVNCTTKSNAFYCETNETIQFYDGYGITAQLPLADNFFNRKSDTKVYVVSTILALLVLALNTVLKLLYAPFVPIIEKVSFEAPEGFNSAMVGYIYDDVVNDEDVYSLLFHWANQGIILINEDENGLVFTKLKELPINIEKFEKSIFDAFFKKSDVATIESWQASDVYSKISANKHQVINSVISKGPLYNKKALRFKRLGVFIVFVGLFLVNLMIFSFNYLNFFKAIVSTILVTIASIFIYAFFSASIKDNIRNSSKLIDSIIKAVFFGSINGYLINVFFNSLLGLRFNVVLLMIIYILFYFGFLTAALMRVRTRYSADLYGEVLGLRTFIKYAKADELKVMQYENPTLYYDVLPYAYAFGISELWLEHFRSLEIPPSPYYTSYHGYTNYHTMNNLTSSMSTMKYDIIPKVEAGSGGGSFSSSGGGGFSGGGFSGGGGFGGGGGGGR